jgi:hypothetical protein
MASKVICMCNRNSVRGANNADTRAFGFESIWQLQRHGYSRMQWSVYFYSMGPKFFLRSVARQEISCLYGVTKVQYRVHKSPSLVPLRSQMNLVRKLGSYLSLRSIMHLDAPNSLRISRLKLWMYFVSMTYVSALTYSSI